MGGAASCPCQSTAGCRVPRRRVSRLRLEDETLTPLDGLSDIPKFCSPEAFQDSGFVEEPGTVRRRLFQDEGEGQTPSPRRGRGGDDCLTRCGADNRFAVGDEVQCKKPPARADEPLGIRDLAAQVARADVALLREPLHAARAARGRKVAVESSVWKPACECWRARGLLYTIQLRRFSCPA